HGDGVAPTVGSWVKVQRGSNVVLDLLQNRRVVAEVRLVVLQEWDCCEKIGYDDQPGQVQLVLHDQQDTGQQKRRDEHTVVTRVQNIVEEQHKEQHGTQVGNMEQAAAIRLPTSRAHLRNQPKRSA